MQCDTRLAYYLIGSSRPRACLIGPSIVASGRRLIEGEIVVRSHVTGSRTSLRVRLYTVSRCELPYRVIYSGLLA